MSSDALADDAPLVSSGSWAGRIVERARELCKDDGANELAELGPMAPSRQVSPLTAGGYSTSEYSMMERDRSKYLLYAAGCHCTQCNPLHSLHPLHLISAITVLAALTLYSL